MFTQYWIAGAHVDSYSCRHEMLFSIVLRQQPTAQDCNKSFTQIEHRAGAVGREGLVH